MLVAGGSPGGCSVTLTPQAHQPVAAWPVWPRGAGCGGEELGGNLGGGGGSLGRNTLLPLLPAASPPPSLSQWRGPDSAGP